MGGQRFYGDDENICPKLRPGYQLRLGGAPQRFQLSTMDDQEQLPASFHCLTVSWAASRWGARILSDCCRTGKCRLGRFGHGLAGGWVGD